MLKNNPPLFHDLNCKNTIKSALICLYLKSAARMHQLCSVCYDEEVPASLPPPRYCQRLAGYGSFMLNTELFFSVPNKCASQYMNQLAFALMKIQKHPKGNTPFLLAYYPARIYIFL